MYWKPGRMDTVTWLGLALLMALVTACNHDEASTQASAPPSAPAHTIPLPSMHFLVEAEVILHTDDPDEMTIDHELFLFNAGTETCNNIEVQWQWPEQLADRIRRGSWAGPVQPFKSRDFGVHFGSWTFEVPEDERAHLDDWMEDARITVACSPPGDYEVTVIPRLLDQGSNTTDSTMMATSNGASPPTSRSFQHN